MTFCFKLQTAARRFRRLALFLAVSSLGLVTPAFAKPGDFDPKFNIGGLGPKPSRTKGAYPLKDGRVLVTGPFRTWNGHDTPGIVLLEKNGKQVASFRPSKAAGEALGSPRLHQILPLSSQRVLVLLDVNEIPRVQILNMDGSLADPAAPQPGNLSMVALVQVTDGSFYGVGLGLNNDGSPTNYHALMIHFTRTGDYDNAYGQRELPLTLGSGGHFGPYLALEPGGTLLLALSGMYLTDDPTLGYLARLRLDGTLDPASKNLAFTSAYLDAVKVLANGSILINSYPAARRGNAILPQVARLKANGQVDKTFNSDAFAKLTMFGNGLNILPTSGGRSIWILAFVTVKITNSRSPFWRTASAEIKMLRLTPDGEVDSHFVPINVDQAKETPLFVIGDKIYYAYGAFPPRNGQPTSYFGRFLLK